MSSRPATRLALAVHMLRFCVAALIVLLTQSVSAVAQDAAVGERVYKHSQVEVEQALQALQAYATNRLPVLDGFANANAGTLVKFENPHYQFRIDVESQGPSQTLVSITSKITAWSADADTAHSQYVVIPSNGRLEQDMLDRLSVYLEKAKSSPSPDSRVDLPNPPAVAAAPRTPVRENAPGSLPPGGVPGAGSPTRPAGAKAASHVDTADPAALATAISAAQSDRQQAELNERKLQQQVSELEANSRTQKYLSNLAIIKAPQTAVFEQDEDTSKVLFRADPEDEFEIIAVKDRWFHVRLENGADGWLRASQLQRPQEVDDTEDASEAVNFTTPNQEVKPFAGEWAPLKGKPALFVFAQPSRAIPDGILGQSQLRFVKHIFTEGYREAAHSEQPISGVVVVFLGDKGGVASATLTDIRRWRDSAISDKVFLERCSFDPPESFRDSSVIAAVHKN